MNTLEKILKQELKIDVEKQKLFDLHKQYIKENRKFPIGYFVCFDDYGKSKVGRIQRAYFKDTDKGVGVQHSIFVVTKNGSYSNLDKSHYYKFEKELTPHPVLNAMSNQ